MAKVVRSFLCPDKELSALKKGETLVWLVVENRRVVDVVVFQNKKSHGRWFPHALNPFPLGGLRG